MILQNHQPRPLAYHLRGRTLVGGLLLVARCRHPLGPPPCYRCCWVPPGPIPAMAVIFTAQRRMGISVFLTVSSIVVACSATAPSPLAGSVPDARPHPPPSPPDNRPVPRRPQEWRDSSLRETSMKLFFLARRLLALAHIVAPRSRSQHRPDQADTKTKEDGRRRRLLAEVNARTTCRPAARRRADCSQAR